MADRIDGDLVELCIAAASHAVDARKAYANLLAEAERRGAAKAFKESAEIAKYYAKNSPTARSILRGIRARASQENQNG